MVSETSYPPKRCLPSNNEKAKHIKLSDEGVDTSQNLPTELYHEILGYFQTNSWHEFRLINKRWKECINSLFASKYRKILNKLEQDKTDFDYIVIQIIKATTVYYEEYGPTRMYIGKLVALLENNIVGIDTIDPSKGSRAMYKMQAVLYDYFDSFLSPYNNTEIRNSKMLFVLSLINIIKRMQNFEIISNTFVGENSWNLIINLRGSWFGIVCGFLKIPLYTLQYNVRNREILILFAVLSLMQHTDKSRRIQEIGNLTFIVGHKSSNAKKIPGLQLEFRFRGSKSTLNFSKEVIIDNKIEENLPEDYDSVEITMSNQGLKNWGYPLKYGMHLERLDA